MGYDYNYNGNKLQLPNPPGSMVHVLAVSLSRNRFRCQVKLLSFTGTYRNNIALLNWVSGEQGEFLLL